MFTKRSAKPLPGKLEEEGLFFSCVNCGFPCKKGRDQLGDNSGIVEQNYSVTVFVNPSREVGILTKECDIEHFETILKLDSNGDVVPPAQHWHGKVVSGCPNCGRKNWMG
jgi:hypothetical protein